MKVVLPILACLCLFLASCGGGESGNNPASVDYNFDPGDSFNFSVLGELRLNCIPFSQAPDSAVNSGGMDTLAISISGSSTGNVTRDKDALKRCSLFCNRLVTSLGADYVTQILRLLSTENSEDQPPWVLNALNSCVDFL